MHCLMHFELYETMVQAAVPLGALGHASILYVKMTW
jgi:hypothetical protein